jgi:hypothetical protein
MNKHPLRLGPLYSTLAVLVVYLLTLWAPTVHAAITVSTLYEAGSTTNANSYTSNTASGFPADVTFSVPTNELGLCFTLNRDGDVDPATALTQTGQTWELIASVEDAADTTNITAFRTLGAGAAAAEITVSGYPDNQTNLHFACYSFAGVDTSGTEGSGAVIQTKTAGSATVGTSFTVTLDSGRTANSALILAAVASAAQTWTGEMDYTLGTEVTTVTAVMESLTQWVIGGTDTTPTLTGDDNASWSAFAVEVKMAAVIGGAPRMMLMGVGE